MSVEQVINRLFKVFGGNAIEILRIDIGFGDVEFRAKNTRRTYYACVASELTVYEVTGDTSHFTPASMWVRGLLLGQTRDDEGRLSHGNADG